MARITVEDCLKKVNNRFALIHMASKRVRQLRKGAEPSITSKNRDIVISLREIAAGNIEIADPANPSKLSENQVDVPTEDTGLETEEKSQEDPEKEGTEV